MTRKRLSSSHPSLPLRTLLTYGCQPLSLLPVPTHHTGGFYYGVMFFTDWQFGSLADAPFKAVGINNWLFEGLRIHHTGSSGIKMTMATRNVTIRDCEVYSAGFRFKNYGHGVEGVQAHNVSVLDSYIHDVAGG